MIKNYNSWLNEAFRDNTWLRPHFDKFLLELNAYIKKESGEKWRILEDEPEGDEAVIHTQGSLGIYKLEGKRSRTWIKSDGNWKTPYEGNPLYTHIIEKGWFLVEIMPADNFHTEIFTLGYEASGTVFHPSLSTRASRPVMHTYAVPISKRKRMKRYEMMDQYWMGEVIWCMENDDLPPKKLQADYERVKNILLKAPKLDLHEFRGSFTGNKYNV